MILGLAVSVLTAWAIETKLAYSLRTQFGQKLSFPRQTRFDFADPDNPGQILVQLAFADLGYNFCWLARNGFGDLPSASDSGVPPLPAWFLPPRGDEFASGSCALGIPMRCLKYDIVIVNDDDLPPRRDSYRHAVCWTLDGGKTIVALPTSPIWPGLVLNALFYAALFSTPWTLRAFRRHLRLRRGHCPFCNYDLRGEFSRACSECGRTANAAAAFRNEPGTQ